MSEIDFERRIARALHTTPPSSANARRAIMDRIRESGGRPVTLALPMSRTARHTLAGLALAASIGSVTTLASLTPSHSRIGGTGAVSSTVIGDSVVDRVRDTLRLVRLIFDDTAAQQVAVVGDFNHWNERSTRMQRDARTRRWSVTLALHDGEHRYAILVDNTRWSKSTPSRSLMVARAAN